MYQRAPLLNFWIFDSFTENNQGKIDKSFNRKKNVILPISCLKSYELPKTIYHTDTFNCEGQADLSTLIWLKPNHEIMPEIVFHKWLTRHIFVVEN